MVPLFRIRKTHQFKFPQFGFLAVFKELLDAGTGLGNWHMDGWTEGDVSL
jgi:hypothetical protein